jgi:hypothetical protein
MCLEEIVQDRNRKIKELEDRQSKEIKEAKWIYNEEKRLRN